MHTNSKDVVPEITCGLCNLVSAVPNNSAAKNPGFLYQQHLASVPGLPLGCQIP